MNFRALIAGAGPAGAALLVSCSSPPQEPSPLPPPVHDYRVVQIDKPGTPAFEMCRDCPKPTRKTLPSPQVRLATAPATAPAAVTAPVQPAAPPQPKPPRQFTAFVHFDLNSAKLTALAKTQIAAIAPVLKLATQVQVTGFTDDLGGQELNTRLSDARSLSVDLALHEQLGAKNSEPAFSRTGRPLCCYLSENRSEAQRQSNRRAEVRLTVPDSPQLAHALQALPETTRLRELSGAPMAGALAGSADANPTQP